MRFSLDDQMRFAALSGDWNPIHVDPVFARRTSAGTAVVHGVHLLAQALEQTALAGYASRPLAAIRASFTRFVAIGDEIGFTIEASGDDQVRIRIEAAEGTRSQVVLQFGAAQSAADLSPAAGPLFDPGTVADCLAPEAMSGLCGIVPVAHDGLAWAAAFPHAAAWLGADRLAALGTSTRLVGMVCPGLHSVFLELRAVLRQAPATATGELRFTMGTARHGLIDGAIEGDGINGTVKCLIRAQPVDPPPFSALRAHIAPDVFAEDRALVIGGSRGLGAVVAKLLAAGGANVSISYAQGEAEANRIAAEIRSGGGRCDTLRYRVGAPATEQLADLGTPPSHVYYFATPPIGRANSRFYDPERFRELLAFYVDGFWDLATAIRERRDDARLFYPSTLYVEQRPRGLAEYAMAKAAGEALCVEMTATMAPLRIDVARLPQLATDQNLTSSGVAGGDPADALLPHLLAMHRRP